MGYYATQQFTDLAVVPFIGKGEHFMVSLAASQNIARGTILAETTSTGLWAPYTHSGLGGLGTPKGIAMYDMQTDSNGNITFSSTSGQAAGPWGETLLQAPVWVDGKFAVNDLTISLGTMVNVVSYQPAWHLIEAYATGNTGGILEI